MKTTVVDFLKGGDNVYRTRHFIVKQVIRIQQNEDENNILVSFDTYYKRTPQRDAAYMIAFHDKKNLEGRRLPSSSYIRAYID